MGFDHDEEVTSPYPSNAVKQQNKCSIKRVTAYFCSLKRQRPEQAAPSLPSKKLHKMGSEPYLATARFLYYENDRWVDFPADLAQGLSASLRAGKSSVNLLVQSCLYFVNFLRMVLVNSQSAYGRSIAFIDEEGERIGFSSPFEGPLPELIKSRKMSMPLGYLKSSLAESMSNKKTETTYLELEDSSDIQQTSVEHHSGPETSFSGENDLNCRDSSLAKEPDGYEMHPYLGSTDSSSESGCGTDFERGSKGLCENQAQEFASVRHKIQTLNKDEVAQAVKRRFLAGVGFPARMTVQAVYQTLISGRCAELRRQAFEMQKKITHSARGNSNVRCAWFGASKSVLQSILLHGFSQPTLIKRSSFGGIGVHFSGNDHPSLSMTYSEVDEKGLQHMLLCQVILGNMEVVQSESDQFQPSSEDFDSGVDDLENPKCLCVWSTHLNTHIFPTYLISFNVSQQLQDMMEPSRELTECNLPSLQLAHKREILDEKKETPDSPCSPLKDIDAFNLANGYPFMMSFPVFLSILKKHVHAETVAAVIQLLTNFKAQKLSREQFMEAIKVVVGKKLIVTCIGEMKSKTPSNIAFFCNVLPKQECKNQDISQRPLV